MKQYALIAALMVTVSAMGGEMIFDGLASTKAKFYKWGEHHRAQFLDEGGPEKQPAFSLASDNPSTAPMMALNLPVDELKGKKVKFSAWVKAENVRGPQNPVIGVKFMINYVTTDKKQEWPEGASVGAHRRGTYDWTELSTVVNFPENVEKVTFYLGFQGVTGVVYFSDINGEVVE